jgi:hypothetical protein
MVAREIGEYKIEGYEVQGALQKGDANSQGDLW